MCVLSIKPTLHIGKWCPLYFLSPTTPKARDRRYKKDAYWSEMARNVIESDLQSSKMDARDHFVKKYQKK